MSMKYRQRGYQDEDRPSGKGGQRQSGRREDRLHPSKPRGRGLGAPTEEVFKCAVCGAAQAAPETGLVATACPDCHADLHTCTNCTHFDTSARFQCRQPVSEAISKKSKRNECEAFEAKVAVGFAAEKSDPSDPHAAFDDLFKGL